MKKVFIEIENLDNSFITDAIENGVEAFFVDNNKIESEIKKLARIEVYNKKALPPDIKFLHIKTKQDEIAAAKINTDVRLIISTENWKIIPLENIIAQRSNNYALISSLEEANEALEILEKGVDGVYIVGCSNALKLKILKELKKEQTLIELAQGTIISVEKILSGDRVCIDTVTTFKKAEGLLVGDYSNGMLLVQAEVEENPYVAMRPFRVNAGAVHSYLLMPEGKTKYLAEIKSADILLKVDFQGFTEQVAVGRVKIEKRPLLRIVVKGQKKEFSVILQNAETIRLVTPEGNSKSVVEVKSGDKVVIYETEGGRHFGEQIQEYIKEK
jgi:3-dehydroquinate synthase II